MATYEGTIIEYVLGDINMNFVSAQKVGDIYKLPFMVGFLKKITTVRLSDTSPYPETHVSWEYILDSPTMRGYLDLWNFGGSHVSGFPVLLNKILDQNNKMRGFWTLLELPSSVVTEGIGLLFDVRVEEDEEPNLCKRIYGVSVVPEVSLSDLIEKVEICAAEDKNLKIQNIQYNEAGRLVSAVLTLYKDINQNQELGTYDIYAEYDSNGRLSYYRVKPRS